ncbi:MAG: amidohydrolase family protein [Deltaproteobacteria bacterium]|nr:amidohydrolase family protein [Deltaproteobacteria bacterium]
MSDKSCIHAGWLIDGSSGPIRKDVLITIHQHIIQSIKPAPKAAFHQSSPFQDLSEYTLLPSLVDCHVHLFMSGTDDIAARKRQLEAGYDELKDVISEHIARHVYSGVGAVRDGGDGKGLVQRYQRESLELNDDRKIPHVREGSPHHKLIHVKVAGKAWHQCGRYGKLIGRSPAPGQSLAEAIRHEARLPEYSRPDHIKVVNSGVNSLLCFGKETLPQFSLEELTQAVNEAGRRHLKVMVHANGRLPVQIAVEAGCHSIEHGFFMGAENLARMRDRQTVWVPTAFTMRAYASHLSPSSREADTAKRNLSHQMDQLRMARELGVPVAIGTDAGSLGVHHGISVREELRLLLEAGYTIPEVVQCATKTGAGLLEITDMGLLTPGMPASWIAVKGNPSGIPESLKHIIQAEWLVTPC